MRVYLAGPINGCSDAEANDWRNEIIEDFEYDDVSFLVVSFGCFILGCFFLVVVFFFFFCVLVCCLPQ